MLRGLASLAPDIATAVVDGLQPPAFNTRKLMRLAALLPGETGALLDFTEKSGRLLRLPPYCRDGVAPFLAEVSHP
jgi:hypothetical protein